MSALDLYPRGKVLNHSKPSMLEPFCGGKYGPASMNHILGEVGVDLSSLKGDRKGSFPPFTVSLPTLLENKSAVHSLHRLIVYLVVEFEDTRISSVDVSGAKAPQAPFRSHRS
jgi:hypothetical protein